MDEATDDRGERSSVLFFGKPWGVPALEGATRVPAPVGDPCLTCTEPIAEDDRGFLRAVIRDAGILTAYEVAPVHAECEVLGIVGHDFGVCPCTGHDTASRASALLRWPPTTSARWRMWDRLQRAKQYREGPR